MSEYTLKQKTSELESLRRKEGKMIKVINDAAQKNIRELTTERERHQREREAFIDKQESDYENLERKLKGHVEAKEKDLTTMRSKMSKLESAIEKLRVEIEHEAAKNS